MAKKTIRGVAVNGNVYEFVAGDANLADMESDASKASKSYNVGEHLILNGQYYVVIAPIVENDSLIVDTNIRVETVGNEIAQMNVVLSAIRSHIGMIVQSTTLDTEEKVIAIYGGVSWSKIEGRVLVGEGTLDSTHSYNIGTTGGEPEHTLTVNEMPSHSHSLRGTFNHGFDSYSTGTKADVGEGTRDTSNTGGSQPHNNMQPYKVVYIWERTA